MIQRIKWVDRGFSFDATAGMYPYYVERLKGTVPQIRSIVEALSEEKLTARINNNWSIKEHVGHIADLEALHNKRLDQLLQGTDILLPADMTNKQTYLAEHNRKLIGELISELDTSRNAFIKRLKAVNEDEITRSALHPRLNKQMRIIDLVYFVSEHDNHHITIIRELAENQKKQ
jgi:uncharacterized damage-inducible protein DinB